MTPQSLKLFDDFSRQDVHAIFSPETRFTPQAGTWGLQGIVDVPDRPVDYVFFVTFGQEQGTHKFDEFVTEDGVLSWQSQPKQGFDDRRIKNLIAHDETVSNVYLFLRTTSRRDYTYLGRLKYLDHDSTKERPVYFQWQILDWSAAHETASRIGLRLSSSEPVITGDIPQPRQLHNLIEAESPRGRQRGHAVAHKRGRVRRPDYIANHAANEALGLLGELLVLRRERERLIASGRPDLADLVRHTAVLENDTAGYDILSFDAAGAKRFIEVKTTRGPADADFFMSANELAFAAMHPGSYCLYRLYDYVDEFDSAKYFVVPGEIANNPLLELVPTNFKVRIYASNSET